MIRPLSIAIVVIALFASQASAFDLFFGGLRTARINRQAAQLNAINNLRAAQLNSLALRQQVVVQPVQRVRVQRVQQFVVPQRVQQVRVQRVLVPQQFRQQFVQPVRVQQVNTGCTAFFSY